MQKSFILPKEHITHDTGISRQIHSHFDENIFETREVPSYANPRRAGEKMLLSCITLGNPFLIDSTFQKLLNSEDGSFPVGYLSDNPLTQARYIVICMITLYTRAAIDGGLPESIAFELSDSYIHYIDKQTDIQKINSLIYHALRDFTNAVHTYQLSGCDVRLKICCEYIFQHLHHVITLEDLSRACNLSAHYVSDLFRLELHMSPMRYIRQQKLKYACTLLSEMSLSVARISELLAFPSPSSFSEYFRQEYGMTPSAYRKLHC